MSNTTIDETSLDPQAELRELLRQKCPEIFREGQIDCQRLRQTLGEEGAGRTLADGEQYGVNWAGKSDCFRAIQTPTTATLRPMRKESVDFDHSEHLFIEGDNLEVLKTLQRSYYGRVKMIYIDPPYNTGNDFIYNDRFRQERAEYEEQAGVRDGNGDLRQDGLIRNSKDRGHYHSNWLNMIYPRLFLARNLLRQDGVIFVSIDDNEVHNLRMVMNEIFGEENFIAQFVWNNEGHTDNQYPVKINHEYVLLYIKVFDRKNDAIGHVIDPNTRRESNLWKGYAENSITKNGKGNPPSEVVLPKGFPCAAYDKIDLQGTIVEEDFYREVQEQGYITRDMTKKFKIEYPIRKNRMVMKDGKLQGECTVYSGWANVEKLRKFMKNNFSPIAEQEENYRFFLSENGVIYYKKDRKKARNIVSVLRDMGTTEQMRSELEKHEIKFQYPKPRDLIRYLIQFGASEKDIILDFFAGSGTTAHAVMALNAEDGGRRQCISVQLPELCDEKEEAYKAGYRTIADIAKERIRRTGKEIAKEHQERLDMEGSKLDTGFKAFKLDQSNFKLWRTDITDEKELREQMNELINNVHIESTEENILYELILKSGLDLTVCIDKKQADTLPYYLIDGGRLCICLAERITKTLVDAIIAERCQKVICLDRSFDNNDQLKTNTTLQLEQAKVEFKVV